MFSFFLSVYYWQHLTYHASFALVFIFNITVAAALIFSVALILQLFVFILRRFCLPKPRFHYKASQIPLIEGHKEENIEVMLKKGGRWTWSKIVSMIIFILDFISAIFYVFTVLTLSIIPSAFYGLHLIAAFPTMFSTLFFYSFCLFVLVLRLSRKKKEKIEDPEEEINTQNIANRIRMLLQRHKTFFFVVGLIALTLSVAIPLTMRDSCLCIYSQDYGLSVLNATAVFSTRLIRSFTVPKVCDVGRPCHVYATLPFNTSSSVFINAHTDFEVDNITIKYDSLETYNKNHSLRYFAHSYSYKLDIEENGRRAVHSTLLYNLEPATDYYYEIHYSSGLMNDALPKYKAVYRTLPSNGAYEPFTIAIGGDIGSSDIGSSATSSLSSHDPKVLIIGGDAAYDDGMQTCWYSWDLYLNGFDEYNEKVNRTVPFITSVGNHDVGFNAMSDAKLNFGEIPLYFIYLPQHLKVNTSTGEEIMEVPDIEDRRTFFYHFIGNTMQISLDSGYIASYEDQSTWMKKLLPKYLHYTKFANYHVPIYPACLETLESPDEHRQIAVDNFVPNFETFNFKAVFENHVHLFKATFPLRQDKVDYENGIIYFGDGNWGITPNTCLDNGNLNNDTALIETASSQRHVWILSLNYTDYEIFPVNGSGHQFYRSFPGNLSLPG